MLCKIMHETVMNASTSMVLEIDTNWQFSFTERAVKIGPILSE